MPFGEPIDFLSGGYGELDKQGGISSWLDAFGTESIGRRQKIITYISVGLVLVIFGSHVSLLVNEGWPPPLGLCKIPPVCPTTVLRVWWAGRRLCARLVYYVSVLVEKMVPIKFNSLRKNTSGRLYTSKWYKRNMPFGGSISFPSGGDGALDKRGGSLSWLAAFFTVAIGRREKNITYSPVGSVLVIFDSHVSLLVYEGLPPPLGLWKLS